MQKAAKLLNQHKLLGALAPVFFYTHAQHIGYAYLQVLSLIYFAIFLTGMSNTSYSFSELLHRHQACTLLN